MLKIADHSTPTAWPLHNLSVSDIFDELGRGGPDQDPRERLLGCKPIADASQEVR
jgi:hypothetical protein